MTVAEHLAATAMVLGEGPIRTAGGFACVDIYAKTIIEGSLDGRTRVIEQFDECVSAICQTVDNQLVAAVGTRVKVVRTSSHVDLPAGPTDLRLNDGKADPVGRFVVGTMADPMRPGAGALWSIVGGEARLLLDSVSISNGLAWAANGETMFYIDTPTQRIDAFDYDTVEGTVSGRRPILSIDESDGSPDGMTVDADGGLWVALWGGSCVRRYVDGRLDHVIEVPTPYVTCPTFVGDDLDVLLITTASVPNPAEPGAGDLYIARPQVAGVAAARVDTQLVFG